MDRHTLPTHETESTAGEFPTAMLALVRMLARAEARAFAAEIGDQDDPDRKRQPTGGK